MVKLFQHNRKIQTDRLAPAVKTAVNTQGDYTHIYLRKSVAKSFDCSRQFNEKLLKEKFLVILKTFFSDIEDLRVFEGGIGTGNHTIPFLSAVSLLFKSFVLYGVDNSIPMLEVLEKKVKGSSEIQEMVLANKFIYGYGDLETRLYLPRNEFNLIIMAGVLHSLCDWKKVLIQLKEIMTSNGYLLIIVQNDDWIKTISGCFENGSVTENNEVYNLFKQYYTFRTQFFGSLDKRIRLVYDLTEVNEFLEANEFEMVDQSSVPLEFSYPLSNYLKFIEDGSFFALGTGISTRDRFVLSQVMKYWALSKGYDPNKHFLGIKNLLFTLWKRKN